MAAGNIKYDCTICLGVFKRPKLLPCAHTVCEDCLTTYIKAHATNNKFTCPVCRQSTDVPAGGASKFPNNFYLVEDSEKKLLFCSKHKKMELKFYCRDCSEAVCGECVVFKHKGHNVEYFSTVEEEHKQQLKPLTEQLDEKVVELKKLSENLKHTITHINTSADTACTNVDKQTERICKQLRQQAQDIKNNIIQIQEDSNNTVQKLMEDIHILITKIETCVNCSRDLLTGKTTSKSAVDILPNIQTLIESVRQTSVDLPEVRYPVFTLVDIDTQCLRKLLGKLVTGNEPSFSVSFNEKEMKEGEWYHSNDVICDRTWCISVKRRTLGLCVYLGLAKGGDEREYSCTADVTLKLLNTADDSQSVVEKREGVEYISDRVNVCMLIAWTKLTDPAYGFLQDNRFTIIASVKVTKIKK